MEGGLDLEPVEHLRIGWLGSELDHTVAVDPLRDESRRQTDRSLWVEAIANHPRSRQTASLGCAAWQQKSCRCGSA
jgi:hypothetical protein